MVFEDTSLCLLITQHKEMLTDYLRRKIEDQAIQCLIKKKHIDAVHHVVGELFPSKLNAVEAALKKLGMQPKPLVHIAEDSDSSELEYE